MTIKLRLTREEMRGVATIAQNCCNALSGDTFEAVQYRDALRGLVLKLVGRMPTMKNKNSLTLTEMEALAMHNVLGDLVDMFQPYEMSLGYTILGEMDSQRNTYVGLMKGNLLQYGSL